MGAVDPRKLVWALNRGYLRHGAVFVLAVAGAVVALGLMLSLALDALRLHRTEQALSARLEALRAAPQAIAQQAPDDALPLPELSQRFHINRRILDALSSAAVAPEQIRFKFENVDDAGFVRQTAVFTLKAPWSEIAKALAALQASDRSLYIARLRLEREQPGDPLVTAELQVAVALTTPASEGDQAP
ncbi:hypothetical protein JI752_006055 [Lysobacter sp. MMG2]|uniref:hypothetical protein n=1 Tax=Lysobacter sp. MMG2 TaxID=2801338 RepID=UPI001C22D532|nr:hypothetical protein [Lysobacter sp. MMG2]MBU8975700.1 hypothetical protein [Lysobacter sp. MMG2]